MKLEEAAAAAQSMTAQAIGLMLVEIARAYPKTREIVERDLENQALSLEKCAEEMKAHAKKHQKGGVWACPVLGIDRKNQAVQVVCKFYGISLDEMPEGCETGRQNTPAGKTERAGMIDLLDLL